MNESGGELPCSDQPVLVTGASSGIGFACAQALVEAGAHHLILTGRDSDKLATAQVLLERPGVQVVAKVCDQSNRADVVNLIRFLEETSWPFAVVANVGINPVHTHGPKKLHSLDADLVERTIATNITHTLLLLAPLLKAMRSQRCGRIILMGSQSWQHGIAGQALYNLCKSSLLGLKNSIVSEYGGSGVFCHLLSPGVVLNDRTQQLRQRNPQLAQQQGVTERDVANAVLDLLRITDAQQNGQDRLV